MKNEIILSSYKKLYSYFERSSLKIILVVIAILILLVTTFHFVTLVKSPPVFIDESWNADAAWNWAQTGKNFDPMHSGTLDQVGYEWIRRPNLGTLPWMLTFKVLGLGLFQARLVSYIFGILLLLAVILVGYKGYSLTTGLLAGLFVSLSFPFMTSSHYARQDILLAATLMLLFAMSFWVFEKNRLWMHFILGLGIGLSTDIHQNAILFIPSFMSLYIYMYKRHFYRRSETWISIVGVLVGIIYFLSVHILPNPSAYFLYLDMNDVLLKSATGMSHIPPILSFDLKELIKSAYNELGRFHFYENNLDFALIAASAIFIGFRRRNHDQMFIVFTLLLYISFVLIQGDKVDFYGILSYPFYLILVAETIMSLISEKGGATLQKIFVISLVSVFVINSARHLLRPVNDDRNYDYYSITNEIVPVLHSNDLVLGSPTWWLGLSEYNYKSVFMLTHYYYFNNLSLEESMNKIKPTFLIIDDVFLSLFGDSESLTADPDVVGKLPIGELNSFIDCCTKEMLSIDNQQHGNIKIYKIINTEWVK